MYATDEAGYARTPNEDLHLLAPTRLGIVLLASAVIGGVAAFILGVEKFWLLTNPFYTPSCNVNAKLNCGTVMSSPQSELFGFPNPLLGIAGFAALGAAGAALIAAQHLAGWYWALLQVGVTAGLVFVHWLMFQSVMVIGALCPYCMAVWVVTITAFWYVTLDNVAAYRRSPGPVLRFASSHHSALLATWLLVITALIVGMTWRG